MVVVMRHDATEADIDAVCERVRANGGEAFVSRGTVHTIVGLVGDTERFKAIDWSQMLGVDHVIQVGKPYKMVARDLHRETTVVTVGTVPVGRDAFTLIAGPCAVESEEQTMTAVRAAKDAGAAIMRGDVYKPRTSPYSFQGLGEQGIEILQEARRRFGLPFIVEVVDVSQVAHVAIRGRAPARLGSVALSMVSFIDPIQLSCPASGDGGTISATGLPKRVTRRGFLVWRTCSSRARHLALNSEMATSFIDLLNYKSIPWSKIVVSETSSRPQAEVGVRPMKCQSGAARFGF